VVSKSKGEQPKLLAELSAKPLGLELGWTVDNDNGSTKREGEWKLFWSRRGGRINDRWRNPSLLFTDGERSNRRWKVEAWILVLVVPIGGEINEEVCALFDTAKKHLIMVDTSGHQDDGPNRNLSVPVEGIAAWENQFEIGFEGGGETREQASRVPTADVEHRIVPMNNTDDWTVQ
jgi:hypothetical protein